MKLFIMLVIGCFCANLFAQGYIDMISPLNKRINSGETVFLGDIGPGQTIPVIFDPIVTEGGLYGKGGQYDYVEVVSVPNGWKSVNSKVYGAPKQVEITAARAAKEGNYTVIMVAIDENNADALGNVTVVGVLRVRHDIVDIDVLPNDQTVGANQPARITVKINNKGDAPDTFSIYSEGVPGWMFSKEFYVPASSVTSVGYEVVGGEEEVYDVSIVVESKSSSLIKKQKEVKVNVRSNLISDFKATSHGTMMYPIIEAPIHAFMGIIGSLII